MSNLLAQHPERSVWGLDSQQEELAQAARVFVRPNLHFLSADVEHTPGLPEQIGKFDVIVLAASVQYFPDLSRLLAVLRPLLNPGGEVHLLDSAFYADETARLAARQRSADYYARMGTPDMAAHYFHHTWPEARHLGAENLNASFRTLFLQKIKYLPPFPWLRFR
jgi:trans-aconitate methyltransferase